MRRGTHLWLSAAYGVLWVGLFCLGVPLASIFILLRWAKQGILAAALTVSAPLPSPLLR